MAHELSKDEFDKLMNNFDILEKPDVPVTYRATFRLSKILQFLSEIVQCENFTPDNDKTHNIAITFVREDLSDKVLGYFEKNDSFDRYGKKHNDKKFSQVIPVITGCIARLDDNYILNSYDDIVSRKAKKEEKNIPFLRSGGEGTGLIPPPPKGR